MYLRERLQLRSTKPWSKINGCHCACLRRQPSQWDEPSHLGGDGARWKGRWFWVTGNRGIVEESAVRLLTKVSDKESLSLVSQLVIPATTVNASHFSLWRWWLDFGSRSTEPKQNMCIPHADGSLYHAPETVDDPERGHALRHSPPTS